MRVELESAPGHLDPRVATDQASDFVFQLLMDGLMAIPAILLAIALVALQRAGCNNGQGFLFSPPRPVRAEVLQGLEYVADGRGLVPDTEVTAWVRRQAETLRALSGQTGGTYVESPTPADLEPIFTAIGQQLSASPLAQLYPEVDWETMFRKSGEMNLEAHDWSADATRS